MLYVKYKVLCWCVVCLLYQVSFVQCQLTSVTRNGIDSFRIGDGCKQNASACSSYEALCSVGTDECLCRAEYPHFRNPIIELSNGGTKFKYGSSYGCITQDRIKHQRIDKAACIITPYQSIPHQRTETPTTFNHSQGYFDSCILNEVEVKYPNSNDWRKVPWLNNSFIEFTVFNAFINVKWKKSVVELQGLIITMWLGCTKTSTTSLECLQAKVKGTWTLNSSTVAPPTTVLPTSISTHGGILTQPPATPSTPVTLVKRNAVDAFLVKGGCKGNESLCTNVSASCQQDGWCLCNADNPHFRDPTIKYSGGGSYQNGASYGCISDDLIKHHRINEFMCDITPFQIIPYDENGITTIFISKNGIHFDSCEMIQLEAKFPNHIVRTTNITWVDNTYVQFTPSNSIIYFKWKRSVPKLQGSIITIWLHCYHGVTITNDCLEAKVLGTWPFIPTTTPPNFTSTGPVQASDNWKNVAIALLVVFPIIVIILIVISVFCIHRVKRQLGKQRAETSNPFDQGGSAYEYPVPQQYDGISSRGRDNQTTTESSYMEPIDPNHNSQSTVDNPSSHYQSLKRDNVNQEEQNTYQELVKPENQ